APAPAGGSTPAAAAGNKQPLTQFSWSYHPEIIQENIKLFAQTYGEPPVNYQEAPATSAYLSLLTAKFMAGVPIDLAYVDEAFANRLYKAGYIRALDDFPGVDQIKQGLFPVGLQALTGSDGKLIGLPYWSGPQQLVMHQGHMDQAGLKPPTTWDEF